MIASVTSKAAAALAPLITVPISLGFLGPTGYGAWAAALAITAFVSFADLGIGAGLMTKLSAALAGQNLVLARRLVTSAYVALIGVIAFLLAALWFSMHWIDWASVIAGSKANGESQVELITVITLSGFLFNAVSMLIVRIQYAAQQVALSNVWQTGGSLVGIASIYAASVWAGDQAQFVAAAAFTPGCIALINTAVFFSRGIGKRIRPSIVEFRLDETGVLARIGGKFLLITFLMGGALSTDSWIVAQTTTLAEVPEFSIPARVFGLIGTAVSALSIPLWPANSEAIARGDVDWIRKTTKIMAWVTPGIVAAIAGLSVLLAPFALDRWLSGAITTSTTLLVGLALWSVVQAVVAPIFMVQNAAGVLRPQIIGYCLLLLVIPAKWAVSTYAGIEWIPWVSVVMYCAIIWPAAWIGYRKALSVMIRTNFNTEQNVRTT